MGLYNDVFEVKLQLLSVFAEHLQVKVGGRSAFLPLMFNVCVFSASARVCGNQKLYHVKCFSFALMLLVSTLVWNAKFNEI